MNQDQADSYGKKCWENFCKDPRVCATFEHPDQVEEYVKHLPRDIFMVMGYKPDRLLDLATLYQVKQNLTDDCQPMWLYHYQYGIIERWQRLAYLLRDNDQACRYLAELHSTAQQEIAKWGLTVTEMKKLQAGKLSLLQYVVAHPIVFVVTGYTV
jgi:hypothetical protein